MSRETKRTTAHFLNGLAIAIFAAGLIAPLASGKADIVIALASILGGGLLHVCAMILVSRGRQR